MSSSDPGSVGARSIGAGGGKKGWLKWLLLLVLLLIVAIVLIALLSGDDDDTPAPTVTTPAAATQPPATGGTAANTGQETGTLVTARAKSLLGASAATFEEGIGEPAVGRNIEVLSLIEDDGFFVGTSNDDRVYVEFGADVGEDETGDDYRPSVGDRVNLEGELRPAPDDPGRTLRLERADAQVVERQGTFINATNISRRSG